MGSEALQGDERSLEVQAEGKRPGLAPARQERLAGARVDLGRGADEGGEEGRHPGGGKGGGQVEDGAGAVPDLDPEAPVHLKVDEAGGDDVGLVDGRGQLPRGPAKDVHDAPVPDHDRARHEVAVEHEAAPDREEGGLVVPQPRHPRASRAKA